MGSAAGERSGRHLLCHPRLGRWRHLSADQPPPLFLQTVEDIHKCFGHQPAIHKAYMNVRPSPWADRLFPLLFLSNNLISRIGVILVTSASVFWLFLLPTYLQGHAGSAYMGIILFLMLPTGFFAGLGLIPLGIYLKKKKMGAPILPADMRVLSWSNPDLRRLIIFIAVVTMANIVIGGNLT